MAEYPAEVAALFDDLTAHFRRLLGEELVGIYLFGSLTQGSFDAARSDIDVMVVTRDHIDKGRSDLVRKWLEGMAAANLWTTRLQMMIIGRADILTMNARACHYQFGKFSRGGSDGNPIPWINILESGITLRGLFLINPEGKVAYQLVHDLGIGRNVDEVVRVLKANQEVAKTGEVCPANWTPGGKTMKADPVKSKEYFAASR